MHINSLPDLVFRLIFSKLSLQDLFTVGRVCALWRSYLKEVHSLTILIGPKAQSLITNSCFTHKYRDLLLNDDGTRMYSSQHLNKWFHLTFSSLSLDCAVEMSNIFPNITTLEIAIKDVLMKISLSSVVTLLAKWSHMLKSFKMYMQFKLEFLQFFIFPGEANDVVNLMDTINSMQSLEHLTLDVSLSIGESLKWSNRPKSIDLPILGQLREFNFKSNDDIGTLENSLERFAVPNDNLRQIGLPCLSNLEDFHFKYPQLEIRIVFFNYMHPITFPLRMFELLSHYSSVAYFNIHERGSLLSDTLKFATSLPQMTHLHIDNRYSHFPSQVRLDQLPQLASVQVLNISCTFRSMFDFESNHWNFIFPNVQVVELLLELGYFFYYGNPRFLSKQELQRTLSTFVQCPKLHHIYTKEVDNSSFTAISHFNEWTVLQNGDGKIIVNSKIIKS